MAIENVIFHIASDKNIIDISKIFDQETNRETLLLISR